MKHLHYTTVPEETVEKGAEGVKIRWLITEDDGAEKFVMRHFEIAPGGHTPLHQHEWEHEVFILQGEGEITGAAGIKPFGPGDFMFAPGGEEHQFRNTGSLPVEMLCLIPARKK